MRTAQNEIPRGSEQNEGSDHAVHADEIFPPEMKGHHGGQGGPHPAHAGAESNGENRHGKHVLRQKDQTQGQGVADHQHTGHNHGIVAVAQPAPEVFAQTGAQSRDAHEGHGRIGGETRVHQARLELAHDRASGHQSAAEGQTCPVHGRSAQEPAERHDHGGRRSQRHRAGQVVHVQAEHFRGVPDHDPADRSHTQHGAAVYGPDRAHAGMLDKHHQDKGQNRPGQGRAYVADAEGPALVALEPPARQNVGDDPAESLRTDPGNGKKQREQAKRTHLSHDDDTRPADQRAESHQQAQAHPQAQGGKQRHAQRAAQGGHGHGHADVAALPAPGCRKRLRKGVHHVDEAAMKQKIAAGAQQAQLPSMKHFPHPRSLSATDGHTSGPPPRRGREHLSFRRVNTCRNRSRPTSARKFSGPCRTSIRRPPACVPLPACPATFPAGTATEPPEPARSETRRPHPRSSTVRNRGPLRPAGAGP